MSDTAQLCVSYTLDLCAHLDNDEHPDTIQNAVDDIKIWLSQLEQSERADVIGSIRAQLADRDNGARACAMIGIDSPTAAAGDVGWVHDGVIVDAITALADNGASPDALASLFDLLAIKSPTEHIVYRSILRERLNLQGAEFDAALKDAQGRSGDEKGGDGGPLDLQGALDAYSVLRQRHEDYLMDCVSRPGTPEPEWLELIKEIVGKSNLSKTDIGVFLSQVGKPPYLVKRKQTELKNYWRESRKADAAQQILSAANVEKPPTWPYDIQRGRLVHLSERTGYDGAPVVNTNPIADFQATIAYEITREGGEKLFIIDGQSIRGGPFALEIAAEDYGSDHKLRARLDAASGSLDPVRARMGNHLGPAIKLLTKQEERRQVRRYERTGWMDNRRFLIPGRPQPGIEILLKRKLPYYVDQNADLRMGLEGLDALLQSMTPERATVVASVVFQAPLARLAGWSNERYALFVAGRSGSLKTTFAQTLMCIYGPDFVDDTLLTKWGEGATNNALMGKATIPQDMPFLIDNYKPSTGGGAGAFIGLIHNIVEGGEKERMNRAAELRDTKPLYCWPICTGEDVPDGDPASLARILVVPFLWQSGEDNELLSKAQELAPQMCAVGNAWIAWLESDATQDTIMRIASKFKDYRSKWAATLRGIRKDSVNILRVASNLATNELTWEILSEHPEIGALARKYREAHMDGLVKIVATTMAEATAEALEATRYIAALKELLATEKAIIIKNWSKTLEPHERDRVIGWSNSTGIFLLPAVARRAAAILVNDNFNGISNLALNKQLDALGLIASKRAGQYTKSKRIGERVERVLHLLSTAFDIEEDAAEQRMSDGERIAAEIPM
jgi:hypothetical protein